MKKVLIITYYFPPSGGPGVQRVLKFVKYLPEFGWQPVVLTVTDADYPARDESLLDEIPSSVHVYRSKIFEPYRLYRKLTGKPPGAPVDVDNIPHDGTRRSFREALAQFVRSTFFIPDARVGWLPYAVPMGLEIIKHEGIDALYSSSPPYTSALVARRLRNKSRLPWIAGFRDPWTGFLSTPQRSAAPAAIDRYMEFSVLRDASLIEVAWKGILKDMLAKHPRISPDKFLYLPNGYDADDFPAVGPPQNEQFTVTYTGSMYGKRNPQSFLRAVESLVDEGSVELSKIRLRFIGRFGSDIMEMIGRTSVSKAVETVAYLPHRESLEALLRSDALLLVVDEAEGSAEIVPGKVFEYLGAHRPIIALAQEGAVADLVRKTRSGFVAANQDLDAIRSAFLECYRNFFYHKRPFEQERKNIEQFERREITRHLSIFLDTITGRTIPAADQHHE